MAKMVAVSSLQIGSLLSRSGHFSDVYLGHNQIHGEVAVKLCKPLPLEPQLVFQARQAALLVEGQRLKQASHPNVVKVYDVLNVHDLVDTPTPSGIVQALGSQTAHVLLVTELCHGGSAEIRSKPNPMLISAARTAVYEVALGLQAVHAAGLLHRDIKPGNILFDGKGHARLSDFGLVTDQIIAGFAGPEAYNPHLPPEFYDLASPTYGKTSVSTDIWAFGLTIYRLISGDHTWQALGGSAAAVSKPKGKSYFATLPWLPHVAKEWRTFVKRCLNEDPAKRYLSMSDVIIDIERLPGSPDWNCTCGATTVWTRAKATRTHEVIWDRTLPTSQTWSATNKPTSGLGNAISLGGQTGPIDHKTALNGLECFFQAQK